MNMNFDIETWQQVLLRAKDKDMQLVADMMNIQIGAIDDIRKNGHLLEINGKTASEMMTVQVPAEDRAEFAGIMGSRLINVSIDATRLNISIQGADFYPHCIFMAIAATLEKFYTTLDTLEELEENNSVSNEEITLSCHFESQTLEDNPLSQILTKLEAIYSHLRLIVDIQYRSPTNQTPSLPKRSIADSNLVFVVESGGKIDTMRTGFSGEVQRGTLRQGDRVSVVDDTGQELCRPGIVMNIFIDGQEVAQATSGQYVDEMLVAVEIPSGSYNNIMLIEAV